MSKSGIKEYPKLVRNKDGVKVRCLTKEDEAKLTGDKPKEDKKQAAGWDNK